MSKKPENASNPNQTSHSPVASKSRPALLSPSLTQIVGSIQDAKPERERSPAKTPQNPTKTLELQRTVSTRIDNLRKMQANNRKLTSLAAFIPDYILFEDTNRKIPYQSSTEAVVLMADVSGFTALTEAYSLKGKGGTDQLTKTLMAYIGPLAECILQADGDIVKYAGDAFLAFWKTTPTEYAADAQRVIDCALYIQQKYGSYLCKEVDITIRVKIGIGAGTVHLCWIGNDAYQHYVCFGPGVEGASSAEKNCTSGDVVVHTSVWKFCDPKFFKYTIRNKAYYVITDIHSFINPEKRGRLTTVGKSQKSIGDRRSSIIGDETIRLQIADGIQTKTEDFLRKFVIPPVLKKLDDDIPLEYLNESRMICICFMHVEITQMSHEGVSFRDTMTQIVNKAFVKIYSSVTRMQGALTKVIMFDKGLTYLVVFGLPGFINENQCAHALKFSYQMRRGLESIKFVTEVSIGVTFGPCYCGVLGHPRRQEYTVIGRKVNKAARLMVYYPGKVCCDQDTAYHSKLPTANFDLMPFKELKGIANPGKIYEFVNLEDTDEQRVSFFPYPILGRDPEMRFFKDVLKQAQKELPEHSKLNALTSGLAGLLGKEAAIAKGAWMIVFEGDNGIGKSRVLSACIMEAEKQEVRAFSVAMNLILSGQSLFGLSSLVIEAAGMTDLRTIQEREDFLRKRVQDAPELASELCLLNDILHTKFPLNAKYATMEVSTSHVYGQHVLHTLLKLLYPDQLLLFAIDDAHLLDVQSWEYILYLSRTPNIVTMCSLRRNASGSPRIPDSVTKMIYHNKNIKIIRLSPLDLKYMTSLACQIMEVKAIPRDVENIIIKKSQGVPAWCDQVLSELVRTGVLKLLPYSTGTKKEMFTVEESIIRKITNRRKKTLNAWAMNAEAEEDAKYAKSSPSRRTLASVAAVSRVSLRGQNAQEIDPQERMLVVKSDTNIAHVPISGTLQEILMDAYDELGSTEQIMLKCASVLGRKFSKQMLTRILPLAEVNAKKYETGFNHLMEARYLRCASGGATKTKDQSITSNPECYCRQSLLEEAIVDSQTTKVRTSRMSLHRPRYWNCKFMEFAKDNLVEVVYDLMTEDQRKDFHLKAAKYLDSSSIKCESCGGGNASYVFGIGLRPVELGVLDNEEALKVITSRRRSTPRQSTANSEHIDKVSQRGTAHTFLVGMEGSKRTSDQTQVEGVKRTFKNNGAKIGQIELDILQSLRKLDAKSKSRFWCCKRKSPNIEVDYELENELHSLRNRQEDNVVNLKVNSDDENDTTSDLESESIPTIKIDGSGEPKCSVQQIDLRICECAALQAKICIEMVRHYREAQKYGKCLVNLLDAAESVIVIGNGTQALVHLEDATGLIRAIAKGEFPPPDKDDKDDARIEHKEAEGQIEYLNGLAYFEIGVHTKAKDFFIKALKRLGLDIKTEENHFYKEVSLLRAKWLLRRSHFLQCCRPHHHQVPTIMQTSEETWTKKIRILSYLHVLFKQDKKMDLALLVTLWEVITAERYGDTMQDVVPSYCNMMEMYAALSRHKDAQRYENMALDVIRSSFGSSNRQIEAIGLLTTANLFYTVSSVRLNRGSISSAADAGYMALRISQIVHDNSLIIRVIPTLVQSLLLTLRIPEVVEALQKLWYTAEEEDDWCGVAMYYAMSLNLLLNTAYPIEQFASCENFVEGSDWASETNMFQDFELQFYMEASLALWYARYSQWDKSTNWLTSVESHRPKQTTFLSVSAELILLECQLIFVNHYLECKRYQHFAKSRNEAKTLMRSLTKSTKVIPILKPRFLHLMAYYYRVRSRNMDAEKHMKIAEKFALEFENRLEQEWIGHNRIVWNDKAIPTVKYFWLEHTENHTLDWHSSGKIPWANIMYSLPLPTWK